LSSNSEKFEKEIHKLKQERLKVMRSRMKRLKYLYRKKTKGVCINLHNINKSSPEESKEGHFKRMRQYEHFYLQKVGFISRRRELLTQTDHPDPTKRYQSLKTTIQEKEEEELKTLIEYFEKEEPEQRNELTK